MEYAKLMEKKLAEHGDTPEGNGWTSGAETRYDVMLDFALEGSGRVSVLDAGCGTSRMFDRLHERGSIDKSKVDRWVGYDVSPEMVRVSRQKHPANAHDFAEYDPFTRRAIKGPPYDYVLACGVFHWKGKLSQLEALRRFTHQVDVLWTYAKKALVFNVMSTFVDWQDDELFYLSPGLATQQAATVSRNFVLRHDYGLHEFTVAIYR